MSLPKGHIVKFVPGQIKMLVGCLEIFDGNIPEGTYEVVEGEDTFCLRRLGGVPNENTKKFYSEIDKDSLEYKRGREDCYMFLRYFLIGLGGISGININSIKFEVPTKNINSGKGIFDGKSGFDLELWSSM